MNSRTNELTENKKIDKTVSTEQTKFFVAFEVFLKCDKCYGPFILFLSNQLTYIRI